MARRDGGGRAPRLPATERPIVLLTAAAVAWLAGSLALATAAPDLARGVWYTPAALAATHLVALGMLTTAIAGALLHLGPTMSLGRMVGGAWAGGLVWLGAAALAAGLAGGWTAAEAIGGALLTAGGLTLVAGVGRLWAARRGTWPEALAGCLAASGWLVLVLAAGVLAVLNRHLALGIERPRLIEAHAVMGGLGWVGGTVLAVAGRLGPMMLIAPVRRTWPVRAALAAWHPGVALLAAGALTASRPLAAVGIGLLGAALLAFGAHLADAIRRRRRWPGPPAAHLVIGGLALPAAGALALSDPATRTVPAALVLVLIAFGAGITAGHILMMLPTMSWVARFGGLRPRRSGPVPRIAHLAPPVIGHVETALFAAGAAATAAGIAAGDPRLAQLGAGAIAASAGATLVGVLLALLRPPPLRAGAPAVRARAGRERRAEEPPAGPAPAWIRPGPRGIESSRSPRPPG
jgi:hypothetical protein